MTSEPIGATGMSEPFDFDGILSRHPKAARAAVRAETAARAGELVRRARARAGLTQSQLAERVASTQAHVSELERGLGSNGPTVATLDRIIAELDDRLVLSTGRQEAEQARERVAEAETWFGELCARLGQGAARGGLAGVVASLAGLRAAADDPHRAVLLDGFLTGLHFACGAVPGQSAETLEAIRAAIPDLLGDARSERSAAAPTLAHGAAAQVVSVSPAAPGRPAGRAATATETQDEARARPTASGMSMGEA